ncbi:MULTISPECIES: cyclase family protein [Bacteria]|nr:MULTISPECIES: cyclase family protein [Turicibacter]KAA3384375.1 cyclase family protein [Akkermansia muciniphila]EGC92621.1 putative cyclase [Turicibacter sp. HGF1]MBP3904895.1 cyclase family protein [Turicibacter sp.]MCU7201536.1 cyclase family protein [Turicibacter sanguinis]MCU7211727.1 cyclase family protein [Turicibacter sanguinis]
MTKYIDLSYEIEHQMAVYPGDDELKLYRHRFLNRDYYNDTKLETGMHVGTHIDAPSHLLNKDRFICDYPVEKFIGNGCLLDVRNEEIIKLKDEYLDKVQEGDIVLLYTGYDEFFGTDKYFENHPIVDEKLAQFFVDRGVKLIGIDMPSPDQYPFKVHHKLLENDILIIENLRNLKKLEGVKRFEVMAFPLNIRAEASLTRVVARIN